MEPLTVEESNLVSTLRDNLRDVWRREFEEDNYLIKWLRARNLDLKKSEKMLRDHLEWRRRENIDNILETFQCPEVITKFYPGGFCGHDKEGCPLWLEPVGFSDPRGMSQSATKNEIIRSRIYIMEYIRSVLLPQRSAEEGHPVTQINVIFDMRHFGRDHLWKPAMQLFTEITRIDEANYPELMRRCFILYAPAVFPFVYKIISPLLHENTRKKVMPLKDDEITEVLLKFFDAAHLPACYGGQMTDPDGDVHCRSKVCWGGVVPKEYYLQSNLDYMHKVYIARGSTFKLEYQVEQVGTRISWEFQTEDHDLAFGVYKKPSTTVTKAASPKSSSKPPKVKTHHMQEIVATKRCDSHLAREKGEFVVETPGHYVLRFDNTYSWTRGKCLWYRVDLDTPIPENMEECNQLEAAAESYLADVECHSSEVSDAIPCDVSQEDSPDTLDSQP